MTNINQIKTSNLKLPIYNGVYFENHRTDEDGTNNYEISIVIKDLQDRGDLNMYLITSQSNSRDFQIPFHKSDVISNQVLVTLRTLVDMKNTDISNFTVKLSKPYAYISLVNTMDTILDLEVSFSQGEEDEEMSVTTYVLYTVLGFIVAMIICLIICVICMKRKNRQNVQVQPNGARRSRRRNDVDSNKLLPEDYDIFFEPFDKKDLPKRTVKYTQDTCSICIDNLDNDEKLRQVPMCDHIFHDKC